MVRKWMGIGLLALAAPAFVVIGACGTDAVGIETCRQIEEALEDLVASNHPAFDVHEMNDAPKFTTQQVACYGLSHRAWPGTGADCHYRGGREEHFEVAG